MSTRRDDSDFEHEEAQVSDLRTRLGPNPNASSGEEDSDSDARESQSGKGEDESDEEKGAGDESGKLARASESGDSDSDDEAIGGGASVEETRVALKVFVLGSSHVPITDARSQVSSVNEAQSETGDTGDTGDTGETANRQHLSDRLAARASRPVVGSSVATQPAGSVLPAEQDKSETSETSNPASERDRQDPGTEMPRHLGSDLERVGSWAADDAGASSSRK